MYGVDKKEHVAHLMDDSSKHFVSCQKGKKDQMFNLKKFSKKNKIPFSI